MTSDKPTKESMRLYNWAFVFNPHTDRWNAFKREEWTNYWNGTATTVIRAKKIETLTYMIYNKLV